LDAHPAERGFTSDMLERDLRRTIPRYDVSDAPGVGRDRAAVVRGNRVEMYRPTIRDQVPKGGRTPPNARNRPGEEQRLEERSKARAEAQRQRTATEASQRERSQIEPPGGSKERPNVQAPAPTTKPGAEPESKPAPEPSTPPAAIGEADAERRAAEQKDFDARVREQRQELKQEQQKDLKNPPAGVSREELQKRHEEEKKAQADVEKRDREELKNREELRRQWEKARQEAERQKAEQQKSQQQRGGKRQKDQEEEQQDGGKQQSDQQKQPDQSQNQDQGQDREQSRQR
jgi:hypothetical protein